MDEDWAFLSGAEFSRRYKAYKAAVNQQRMSSGSNLLMNSTVLTPSQFHHSWTSSAASGPSPTSSSAQYGHSHSGLHTGQNSQYMEPQQHGAGQASWSQPFSPMNGRLSVTSRIGYSSNPYSSHVGSSNQHAMSPLDSYSQASNQPPNLLGQFGHAAGGHSTPLAPPIHLNQSPSKSLTGNSEDHWQRYQQNIRSMQGIQDMHSVKKSSQTPSPSRSQVIPPQQRYQPSVSPQNHCLQQTPSPIRRSPSVSQSQQSRGSSMIRSSPLSQVVSQNGLPKSQRHDPSPSPDVLSLDGYPALQTGLQQQRAEVNSWPSPSRSTASAPNPVPKRKSVQSQGRSLNQSPLSRPDSAPAKIASSIRKSPVASSIPEKPEFLQGKDVRVGREAEGPIIMQIISPTFQGPVTIPPRAEGWAISFPDQDPDQPSEPDCVITGPRYIINMFEPTFLGGISFMGDLPASAYATVPKVPVIAPTSMRGSMRGKAAEAVPNPATPPNGKRAAEEDLYEAHTKRQKQREEQISRELQMQTPAPIPVQSPQLPTPTSPTPVAQMTANTTTSAISVSRKQAVSPTASVPSLPTPPTLTPQEQNTSPTVSEDALSLDETASPIFHEELSMFPEPGSPEPNDPFAAANLFDYSDLDVPFGYDPDILAQQTNLEEKKGPKTYKDMEAELMWPGEFPGLTPEDIADLPNRPPRLYYAMDDPDRRVNLGDKIKEEERGNKIGAWFQDML